MQVSDHGDDASDALPAATAEGESNGAIPSELSPKRVRRRLLEFALVGAVVALVIVTGPGLSGLRTRISHASPAWLILGVGLEALSALSYVVIFRAVFCPRMSWSMSYQFGMSEQAANSVLSVSGAGGLALGAWALHRAGMDTDSIGRKTVAFFFLTSLANVAAVVAFAALYAVGILAHDPNPLLTYAFGVAALAATGVVLALPALLGGGRAARFGDRAHGGRIAAALAFARDSLAQGVSDAVALLRHGSLGVLAGSFGTMAFDLAVLAVAFRAFGASPAIGVIALGYLVGQLGGNIPIPGGIGGLDGGLIGTFALYHQPLAATTAAVLLYHTISLWVPGLMGTVALIRLRRTLQRDAKPATICGPLADPIAPTHGGAIVLSER